MVEMHTESLLDLIYEIDDLLAALARIEAKKDGRFTLDCPISNEASRKLHEIGNFVFDQMKKEQEEE